MATEVRREETPTPPSQLVEMSWDPITRIVGSLGIHTKIDFILSPAVSAAFVVITTRPARSILRIWPMG